MGTGMEARADLTANRGPELNITTTVVLILAVFFVALRFWSRYVRGGHGLDDWMTLVALVFVFVAGAINYAMIGSGLGQHAAALSDESLVRFLKLLLAFECMYVTAVMLVKLALLQMYLRVFPSRGFKICSAIIAFIVIGWWIAIVAVSVFQCSPIKKAWLPTIPGKCIDLKASFIGNAIPNIGTDVAILCMPMRQIWKLHVNIAQKLSLCVIFLLGSFVLVASIYRFTTIMQFDPIDTTWTLATACAWCVVEVACGTIALCLPTLRPLMQQVTRKFDSLTNSKPSYPGGYPSGPGSVPTELVTIGGTGGTRSRQDNFQRLDNGSSPGVNGQDLYRQGSEAQKSEHNYASSGDEVPLHKDQAVSISVEPHRGNR